MPFLNGRGQAVMGLGGMPASVDGKVIADPGGGACWLSDNLAILQTQVDGKWTLATVTIATGKVELMPWTPGATELVAGGVRYAAGLNGSMYGSITRAGAWPKAAGPDGTLAYVRDYQSGLGLVLNAPDGSETDIPHAVAIDTQVLGPASALWHNGKTLGWYGCEPLRPALPAGRTRVAVLNGVTWLVYWRLDDKGLIAQVNGADEGYVLETRPICFNHDARAVSGQIVVAWAETGGEAPDSLRKFTIDPAAPRVKLTAPVVVVPPTDPVEPIKEPTPLRTIPVPARVKQIVQALYERHTDLAQGSDDDRRELAIAIAEQARYELGPEYGSKRADAGRPLSKDALALLRDGVLYSADCFNGTTRMPSVPDVFTEIPGQVFSVVAAVNHLGVGTTEPAPTDKPKPSGGDSFIDLSPALAPLYAKIAALEARCAALGVLIDASKAEGDTTKLLDGARVALRTDGGAYVTAEDGGGGEINAKGPRPFGGWQIFTLELQQ